MRAEKLRWAIEYRLKKLQPGIEWQLEFSDHIELNARVDNLVLDNEAVIYIDGYAELLVFDCHVDDPLPKLTGAQRRQIMETLHDKYGGSSGDPGVLSRGSKIHTAQIDIMPFNRPDVEAQSFNSLFDFELFLEGFLAYYWRE